MVANPAAQSGAGAAAAERAAANLRTALGEDAVTVVRTAGPRHACAIAEGAQGAQTVVDAMVLCGVCKSKGEARRLIAQGGVAVNEEKVTDENMPVPESEFVLQKGKKVRVKVIVK